MNKLWQITSCSSKPDLILPLLTKRDSLAWFSNSIIMVLWFTTHWHCLHHCHTGFRVQRTQATDGIFDLIISLRIVQLKCWAPLTFTVHLGSDVEYTHLNTPLNYTRGSPVPRWGNGTFLLIWPESFSSASNQCLTGSTVEPLELQPLDTFAEYQKHREAFAQQWFVSKSTFASRMSSRWIWDLLLVLFLANVNLTNQSKHTPKMLENHFIIEIHELNILH